MENITKLQFAKFVGLQKSGAINIMDIERGAKIINEPEEVYEEIMWNYSELKEKFKNEKD